MSVHIYVAREWLLRGAMPYRDSFDHKGPGLYALHAMVLWLLGDATWGFRSFELAVVLALGISCAWLTAAPGRRPEPGVTGISVLAANVFAFGFLDYWNTAQGELECALLTTVALLVARRVRNVRLAALLAAALGGAAVLVKPTALLLVVPAFVLVWARARREGRTANTLAWFVASFLSLPIVTTAYFASRGALPAAVDVLVFANRVYVTHEHAAHGFLGTARACGLVLRHFDPACVEVVVLGSIVGLFASRARRRPLDFENNALALGILVCGVASVVVQWKFFLYHWSIAAGGVVLSIANLANLFRRTLASFRVEPLAAPAFGLAIWLAFVHTGNEDFALWRDNTRLTASWAAGKIDEDTFARRIVRGPGKRDYDDIRRIARWIGAHSTPDDYVLVRGEAAEIYVLANRRAPGRFFWSVFLASPTRAYRRDEWLREDARAIATHLPRYVVVRQKVASGPDSAASFAPLGYRTIRAVGPWLILSRTRSDTVLEARAR